MPVNFPFRSGITSPTALAAPVDEGRPQWLVDYDRVKAKAEAGGKLSGKEKKLLKRGQAREAEEAELGLTTGGDDTRTVDARLEGFSLSVPGGAHTRVERIAAVQTDCRSSGKRWLQLRETRWRDESELN